jgi:hypothetical protein
VAGRASEMMNIFSGCPSSLYCLYNSRIKYSGVVAILKPEIAMILLSFISDRGITLSTIFENI